MATTQDHSGRPAAPATAVACQWCATLTTQPVTLTLNFGRTATVCAKCWAFDDGDR